MVIFTKEQQPLYLVSLISNKYMYFYKVELKYLYVRKGQEAAGRVDFFDHMHSNWTGIPLHFYSIWASSTFHDPTFFDQISLAGRLRI